MVKTCGNRNSNECSFWLIEEEWSMSGNGNNHSIKQSELSPNFAQYAFDAVDIPIFRTDTSGSITYANAAAVL